MENASDISGVQNRKDETSWSNGKRKILKEERVPLKRVWKSTKTTRAEWNYLRKEYYKIWKLQQ